MTWNPLGRVERRRRSDREPLPRDVRVLGVVAFFVMLGFGVVIPVLPVFVRGFGVGYIEVGAVVSAFAVMRLVAAPIVGRLVDRWGERVVLAVGIAIVAVSSGAVGIATDYPQVLVLRGLGGIGSAMFSVAAMTLIIGVTSPTQRGRAVGFWQGGFLIGGMAGPAVGGLLTTVSLTAPFFFYAATLAVAGTVGLVLLRGDGRSDETASTTDGGMRSVLRDRRFQVASVANLASGWAAMGVRGALVPVLVVEVLHREPAWTGIAFAIAAVVQTVALGPAGRFVDSVGRRPAIVWAFLVGAVTMMAIPFVAELWMLIALLVVYAVAAAFIGTAPSALMSDAAGGRRGTPVAVFQASADVGSIVGPLAAGALLDAFSYPAAFASAAVLMLAASVFAATLKRD
ncbi:MFS transporter [Labedella phragmitis]|uniref:MFS transporter n=1 Tax=Labedella phragmitis TaxID=2498849 RepID=A0A444PUM9_9MICO|nr:MFS transporter [Labedella phragmitis]RWZ51568.1 MFS transporter [Labedella phragmitis]